jgi:hypothetical protein
MGELKLQIHSYQKCTATRNIFTYPFQIQLSCITRAMDWYARPDKMAYPADCPEGFDRVRKNHYFPDKPATKPLALSAV